MGPGSVSPDCSISLSGESVFLVTPQVFSSRMWVSMDLAICILTADIKMHRETEIASDTHCLTVVEGRGLSGQPY